MNIKPIRTEKLNSYYVKVNKNIIRLDFASFFYPESTREIRHNFYKNFKKEKPYKKYVYPTNEKMKEAISKKAEEILNKYNLKPVKNEYEKLNQVYLIYNHFASSLQYDMLSQEERGYLFGDNHFHLKTLKQEKEKLIALNLKPIKQQSLTSLKMKKIFAYSTLSNKQERLKNSQDLKEENHIKGLYNVFVRKKGVCTDYTNALNFILEKLNIATYKVTDVVKKGNSSYYHAYSLVELKTGKNKQYYICDLTLATTNEKYQEKKLEGKILGFGLGKKVLKNRKASILSIQKHYKINQGRFYPQLEEEILEKGLPTSLTKKLLNQEVKTEEIIL